MKIHSPNTFDSSQYYTRYLSLVSGNDVIEALQKMSEETFQVISSLQDRDLSFSYDKGKWNIGVLLQHVCDAERVFAYRCLRFLRGDLTDLAGFDEDDFADASVGYQKIADFKAEYEAVRSSSIQVFLNSDLKNIDLEGSANGLKFSARVIAWLMVGHNAHHLNVLKEKYLVKL